MCEKILNFVEDKKGNRIELEISEDSPCNILENESIPRSLDNLNC